MVITENFPCGCTEVHPPHFYKHVCNNGRRHRTFEEFFCFGIGPKASPPPPPPPRKTSSKLRFDLIPAGPMHELALAFTVGAEKHGDTDWLDNPKPVSHHVGSLLRHLYAFLRGEARDADGQHHLASVATRAMMIMALVERKGR